MLVFLVPAGRGRFEIYSEPADDDEEAPSEREGRVRQWMRRAGAQWQRIVEAARRGSKGRIARWRDRLVCHLAETLAEQRTLWALRHHDSAVIRYPAQLDATQARKVLFDSLAAARRHHAIWFLIDLALLIAQIPVTIIPGPNVLGFYLTFRVVGHLFSWQGVGRAMSKVEWTFEPDQTLGELSPLVDVPREARAARVAAIAERLKLARLKAFFDRVAVPSSSPGTAG